MSERAHLLLLTLGPVQDFIAQARRTRDLWFGSHLLSELSRAAARRLLSPTWDADRERQPVQARLIFPALDPEDPELDPCDQLLRPGLRPVEATAAGAASSPAGAAPPRLEARQPPLVIANKILAYLPPGVPPRWAAQEARAAAQQRWLQLAAQVRLRCDGLIAQQAGPAFQEQIATFLEFQAAWAPCEPARYQEDRERLEQALAGRKCLRDFKPFAAQRGAVPKSSLDGGRETVLRPAAERDPVLVRRYRVAPSEQLDAVGLVKRAGGDPGQFVPIFNVALAPWIQRAARIVPAALEGLRRACEDAGISGVDRPELPWVAAFPFDAQVLLRSRLIPLFQELRGVDPQRKRDLPYRAVVQRVHEEANRWGQAHVRPLFGKGRMAEPLPYVACLVADGDRVGRTLRALDMDEHRRFSRALSGFPQRARRIVEQSCRGVLVYAGGDDVLALVCLEDALRCADELHRAFAEVMADARPARPARLDQPGWTPPTLSVGIGVGHVLDSLGHLRALGRRAEERAKQSRDRDRLVVLLDRRSGGELRWESPWTEDPLAQLRQAMAVLEHRLSQKKIHEIITAVHRTPRPELLLDAEAAGWSNLLRDDVQRALRRADAGQDLTPEEAGLAFSPQDSYPQRRARILAWGDRLLLARFFAAARSLDPFLPGVS